MKIVCDTNKLFSTILNPKSKIAELIFSDDCSIIVPYFSIIELFKHKEKIVKLSRKTEVQVLEIIYHVISNVEFINDQEISETSKLSAFEFCKDIDPKDSVFVALSIELNAPLWTGDKKLISGLKAKGFNNFFEDSI